MRYRMRMFPMNRYCTSSQKSLKSQLMDHCLRLMHLKAEDSSGVNHRLWFGHLWTRLLKWGASRTVRRPDGHRLYTTPCGNRTK